MKITSTFRVKTTLSIFLPVLLMLCSSNIHSQITPTLGSPINYIYGLTSNGEIYEIDVKTAATNKVIKNNSYSGNSPSSANGLAYNPVDGKFYYFKRNVTSSPQEFVSFDPKTNTVTILASSTCAADVHTGSISNDGTGYYTVDTKGNLNYYNIVTNKWKVITSTIVDQFGSNVTAVIQAQSAGDMAFDGYGNAWLVTSSNSNYGVYKMSASMPTTSVASLTVTRIIAPTASTPSGNSIAGIAFNANGQIFMGTRGDDRLYLLENTSSLKYIAKFSNSDAGNDLTSLNFPIGSILPVKWVSFNAAVQNENNIVLDWKVVEYQNKGFYVQHSLDGSDWENITFIPSKNVSEIVQNYSYSYNNNMNGTQYYRIKQVDIDDKETYTDVKIIALKNDRQSVAVWPNPAKDNICIVNDGTKDNQYTRVQLFDLSGRLFTEQQLQPGKNIINISRFAPGTYFVKVQNKNGIASSQKIIKQ
ncbi:MAG: T9SS type A sorting domain-containing protein [Bacteroidota bacterium]